MIIIVKECTIKCGYTSAVRLFGCLQDPSQLHVIDPPLQDTATLVGHTVNSLPEGHDEYNMAIELVELVQGLL